jgi:hypothetical protein
MQYFIQPLETHSTADVEYRDGKAPAETWAEIYYQ